MIDPSMPTVISTPTIDASPVGAVIIPSGSFLMGGVSEDKFVTAVELPQHVVTLHKKFALGKTPVTQKQWLEVMDALPANCPDDPNKDCPVVCVTYSEVMDYLDRLSLSSGKLCRLPSESEWEYACRAGSSSIFPNQHNLTLDNANYLYDERGNSIGKGSMTPVSQYPENAFGLSDMVGNVCEWTADHWHHNYTGAPDDGSARTADYTDTPRHVIRGGAWDHLPRVLRASWRDWAPADARWDNLGFRIAHDI